jgi:ribosomal protein S18 acetylase RimI-like enzyme
LVERARINSPAHDHAVGDSRGIHLTPKDILTVSTLAHVDSRRLVRSCGQDGRVGVIIRRAEIDDWQVCRDIRLRALREEPQAYESTLEDEQHLSDQQWRDRLVRASTFLAVDHETVVGMAVALPQDDGDVMIVAMYVVPDARGRGIAASLIDEIGRMAVSRGSSRLVLDVADGNAAAERSYRRYGFVPVRQRVPMRRNPAVLQTRLAYGLPGPGRGVTRSV